MEEGVIDNDEDLRQSIPGTTWASKATLSSASCAIRRMSSVPGTIESYSRERELSLLLERELRSCPCETGADEQFWDNSFERDNRDFTSARRFSSAQAPESER